MLIKNIILNYGYSILIFIYLSFILLNSVLYITYVLRVVFLKYSNKYETLNCPEPTRSVLINFIFIRPRIKAFYSVYNYHLTKKLGWGVVYKNIKIFLLIGVLADLYNLISCYYNDNYRDLRLCHNKLWPYKPENKIIIKDFKITRNGPVWKMAQANHAHFEKMNQNLALNHNINRLGIRTYRLPLHAGITHNHSSLGSWCGTSDKYFKFSYINFNNDEFKNIKFYPIYFDYTRYKDTKGVLVPFNQLNPGLQKTISRYGVFMLIEPHLSIVNNSDTTVIIVDVHGGKFKTTNLIFDYQTISNSKSVLEDLGGRDACTAYSNHCNYLYNLYKKVTTALDYATHIMKNNRMLTVDDYDYLLQLKYELVLDKSLTKNDGLFVNHDYFLNQLDQFIPH